MVLSEDAPARNADNGLPPLWGTYPARGRLNAAPAGLSAIANPFRTTSLESNESYWQEQRQVVEDPDTDEIR